MANIKLLRKSSSYDESIASYRMIVEVTQANDITSKIFVNQRLRNFTSQSFEDVFVAVATPAQIEDFAENAPNEGSTYLRTSKIDVVSRNAAYLESVFEDIISNVQKLLEDVEALQVLDTELEYTITPATVEVVVPD